MKKGLSFVLILALALSLAACGSSAKSEPAPAEAPAEGPVSATAAPPAEPAAEPEAAAEPAAEPEAAAETVTVTDMMGREVTIKGPVTRVVALQPADCEIIYALGAGDMVVGRGEYCDSPAEVLDVPSVQSGYDTNTEQIIALEPQVLFMSTMAQSEEQIQALEAAGVAVVVSETTDIQGVYSAIEMIGKALGKEDKASALVEEMKTCFADIAAKSEGDGTKTVYFEVSPLQYGLWTAGKGTFMNEIAEMIGLKNCFDDVDGWASISEEQVLERNPDYIVTITMYFGEGPTPTEELLARPGWENVTAIKNAAILNLVDNELSRPSPRLMQGAQMMYDFVYGGAEENAALSERQKRGRFGVLSLYPEKAQGRLRSRRLPAFHGDHVRDAGAVRLRRQCPRPR